MIFMGTAVDACNNRHSDSLDYGAILSASGSLPDKRNLTSVLEKLRDASPGKFPTIGESDKNQLLMLLRAASNNRNSEVVEALMDEMEPEE